MSSNLPSFPFIWFVWHGGNVSPGTAEPSPSPSSGLEARPIEAEQARSGFQFFDHLNSGEEQRAAKRRSIELFTICVFQEHLTLCRAYSTVCSSQSSTAAPIRAPFFSLALFYREFVERRKARNRERYADLSEFYVSSCI